jgi:cysteinyl-tRNA synthetase
VSLRLYDTAAQELREFTPLVPGSVGIYICGLTTQAPPHIGHVRFAVAFDVLRRWLEGRYGYDVTLVRNVTDIDDKILAKSAEAGEPWFALSYRNEVATSAALASLGVLPPTYEPRATGHIPEMVTLMDTLVEKGHAYPAPDGSGDVYFDVRSFPEYGSLTHQRIEDMEAAEDADPRGKRDPRDFALWKGHKSTEPESASWPTPFGAGRPGWHLECSAMARKYLGDSFDIHGGGVDLRFPHHENEQAQSHAAGLGFANYWLHNAWVTVGGEKMSKSLGNSLIVSEVTKVARPLAVRYYLTAAHYRSTIEYHEGSLAEADAAVERIEGFLRRALRTLPEGTSTTPDPERVPDSYAASMDDDLNVSGALAVVHDTVRAGNTAIDDRDDDALATAFAQVLAMTDLLGVNPLDPH